MPAPTLHIHEAVRILELGEPPYDVPGIQAARRRLAKQWHPDHATPDQRPVHERHMIEINRAADVLDERARELGGELSARFVEVSAQAARAQRREAGERAARAAEAAEPKGKRRRTRGVAKSEVHSYVRSRTHPEWGVGTIVGLFATGEGDEVRRWAEVDFAGLKTKTLRYENLHFVDFGQPDPGHERAQRFLDAGRKAAAEGDHALAVRRLVHARNASPINPTVLRLLALEQHADGDPRAAMRTANQWAQAHPGDPLPHRLVQTIYAEMGAFDLADEAGGRALQREREGRPGVEDGGGAERKPRGRARPRTETDPRRGSRSAA